MAGNLFYETKHNCRCMLCHSTRELLADYKYATGAIANAICEVCKECTSHIIIDMNPPTLPDYIKPGAVVRLRNGEKARIYEIDGGPHPYNVHGAIWTNDHWSAREWAGCQYTTEPNHPRDIISAWKNTPDCSALWPLLPPWIKYLAMRDTGEWRGFMTKPVMKRGYWEENTDASWMWYITIPTEYHPIYSGDWKDSLVERPQ